MRASRGTRARLHLRAMVLVGAARVLLGRRDTTAVLRRLTARTARGPTAVDPLAALAAVRRSGGLVGANCLARSVALAALLDREGAAPSVVVGCRRYAARDWGAHAWVELKGRRLEPLRVPDHTELARFDAAHDWELHRR